MLLLLLLHVGQNLHVEQLLLLQTEQGGLQNGQLLNRFGTGIVGQVRRQLLNGHADVLELFSHAGGVGHIHASWT